jgi:cobalt-zinc-cadmium efflux system membrane fusion protein
VRRRKTRGSKWSLKLFALGLPETEIAVLPDQPLASLRRHKLRSPITGRVAERRVDLGALVGREGQESELYVIADLSEVWADLAVSPAELSNIQEGQVITLFAGASSERAKARVIFVSPLLGIVETLIQNSDEANHSLAAG